MQDGEGIFISTGIDSLNDLLTRDKRLGIAMPSERGFASSTTVIKGAAGVGKSVLAAIISYNLTSEVGLSHSGGEVCVPLPIYFSFSQPARGIYHYLDEILRLRSDAVYPLIVSPKVDFGIPELGGIATLRRTLIEALNPFRPFPFLDYDPTRVTRSASSIETYAKQVTEEVKRTCKRFQNGIKRFRESENWVSGLQKDDQRKYVFDADGKPVEGLIKRTAKVANSRLNLMIGGAIKNQKDPCELLHLLRGAVHIKNSRSRLMNLLAWRFDQLQPGKSDQQTFALASETIVECPESWRFVPFVVIDPINFFFDYRDSRDVVAELFSTFRVLQWPVLVTLEDVGSKSKEEHRQLSSYVEFEADVVVELAVESEPQIRRTVEVTKSRNSQPRFGRQMYRIEPPEHGFSNVVEEADDPSRGFIVIPSIHWVLSHSYQRYVSAWEAHTGIVELDDYLRTDGDGKQLLPPDAFILVSGPKGGHKLPVALNLLVAGLWQPKKSGQGPSLEPNKRVMLISLGEETSLTTDKLALAEYLGLEERPIPGRKVTSNANQIKLKLKTVDTREKDHNFKIMLNRWGAIDPKLDRQTAASEDQIPADAPELIEATFKPGYLTPEEFLWALEMLVKKFDPKRLLLDNTAHLRTRFPNLHKEMMLPPALTSLARANGMMLIVIDVTGPGSNEELSYGLSAAADLLMELEPITKEEHRQGEMRKRLNMARKKTASEDGERTWAKMNVSNVRGKGHRRWVQAVTVSRLIKANPAIELNPTRLLLCEITKASSPSLQDSRRRRRRSGSHNSPKKRQK